MSDAKVTPLNEAIAAAMRQPPSLLSEAEATAFSRGMQAEERRRRLMESPIWRELGEGDPNLIMRGTYEMLPTMRAVHRWVGRITDKDLVMLVRPWLWLGGGTGIGKTMAAAWLIHEHGARYVTLPEAAEDWRAFRRKSGATELEGIRDGFSKKYFAQGFLVLDEIGIEETDEDTQLCTRRALHSIVTGRQRKPYWTLALTNKAAAEIRARFASGQYDQRTESRLEPMLEVSPKTGKGMNDFKGPDLRKLKAQRGLRAVPKREGES